MVQWGLRPGVTGEGTVDDFPGEVSNVAYEERPCPGRHRVGEEVGHCLRGLLPFLESQCLTCPASDPRHSLLPTQPMAPPRDPWSQRGTTTALGTDPLLPSSIASW